MLAILEVLPVKTLVTGATGFIGSHLARELAVKQHHVRALVLPGEETSGLESIGVEVHPGNLLDRESLAGVCDGINTVYHLAGRVTDWGTKKQFYDAIFTATKNLIHEAEGRAERFVYVSSVAALGCHRNLNGVCETDTPKKSGVPYNDAKLDTENLVRETHERGKISCVTVRPSNVIGPGSVWVRDVLDKLKGVLPLVDGGENSGSFVYVDNLVDGLILAGTKENTGGKIYHFRDDWEVTWKEYLHDLGAFIGKGPVGSVPMGLALALARACEFVCTPLGLRPPLTRFSIYITGGHYDIDTTFTRKDLGWDTRVSYRQAMDRIGTWVRQVYLKQ